MKISKQKKRILYLEHNIVKTTEYQKQKEILNFGKNKYWKTEKWLFQVLNNNTSQQTVKVFNVLKGNNC